MSKPTDDKLDELVQNLYMWGVGSKAEDLGVGSIATHAQAKQAILKAVEPSKPQPVDIRRLRKKLKITQQDMAVYLGVSRLTYLKWEKDIDSMPFGKYAMCVEELKRLEQLSEKPIEPPKGGVYHKKLVVNGETAWEQLSEEE